MNIADTILSRGEDAATAVVRGDSVLTYGQLRQDVRLLAAGLLARGGRKGDRIGIWADNSPFFVTAYLGAIRAGLVAVPMQTDLTAETFAKIVSDAGIKQVFVSGRFLNRLQLWTKTTGIALLPEPDLEGLFGDETARMPQIDPRRDLAALMFTSGSTGTPKGVMVSHRNIESNTRDIIAYIGLTQEDRVMVVLPFHYCFGISLLHTHLMAGGTVVLNNGFKLYPEAVLQDMLRTGCTGLAGVPSTYQILLRKSRFRQISFPSLRWFQQAGGKLPNQCIQEILASFPQVRFFLMYGQTEATARLSYLPPERLADKLGSIGRGLPATTLEVLKTDGTSVVPGSTETGEIVAVGDNIALGYWHDAVETARFFRNGRLYTGDIARVDRDGFIFVVEREREIIKSGGNRVSAKEVEDVIADLPEVIEVAVIGTPHELLGEAIRAFVAIKPDVKISSEDIELYCRNRLPPFKIPQEVILLDQMPHNSSGKILKPKLRELLDNRRAPMAGRPSTTSAPVLEPRD